MAKKQKQAFVVTVSGDHRIQKVAKELKAKGFEVDQVLDAIGVVTGSALPANVAKMREVPGVTDPLRLFQLDRARHGPRLRLTRF